MPPNCYNVPPPLFFTSLLCRHTIESGVWGDNNLTYYEGRGYTIREALNFWYENRYNIEGSMVFRDICYGPRCNDGCPEELVLQEQGAKDWSTGVRIMIAIFVVAIAVICILLKVHISLLMWSSSFSITVSSGPQMIPDPPSSLFKMCCILWVKHLEWRQKHYLASLKSQKDEEIHTLTEESMTRNKTGVRHKINK